MKTIIILLMMVAGVRADDEDEGKMEAFVGGVYGEKGFAVILSKDQALVNGKLILRKGEAGSKAAGNGDLYLFISIQNHSLFKRSEENLFFELPIGFADAALGATIEVPCIDGSKVKIKIPNGTQYGKQLRLKEKGMPILRRNSYGDLYIRIIPEVPVSLTKRQKEILEEFKELENTKISPTIKSFFEKAKKFWSSN